MSQNISHPAPTALTGEDLLSLGEVGPCELIDGRIVPMSPTGGMHARIESALGVELTLFIFADGPTGPACSRCTASP